MHYYYVGCQPRIFVTAVLTISADPRWHVRYSFSLFILMNMIAGAPEFSDHIARGIGSACNRSASENVLERVI